jgi:hypothetical protein
MWFSSMSTLVGAASVIPMTGILNAFGDLLSTLRTVIIPAGILGMGVGGLMHTQVFHTPQAKENGRRILIDSVLGILIVAAGPPALTAFGKLLGLP